MFYFFLLLAVGLSLSLFLSVVTEGRFAVWAKAFRIVLVSLSVLFFSYLFIKKSLDDFRKDSLAVQIINKLPFPLDFYMVKINSGAQQQDRYETRHVGKIRTQHYRIDYLQMADSDEYWVAGYLGNKNLVYFSQHSVPNKNEDQIIEIRNYIIQSSKLAERAKLQIDALKLENIKTAIWITLDLLLLFLNLALLLRRKKEKTPAVAGVS